MPHPGAVKACCRRLAAGSGPEFDDRAFGPGVSLRRMGRAYDEEVGMGEDVHHG